MEQINLSQLWTAAAVLAGFQFTALIWRISREVEMEASGEQTWLTLSDYVAAIYKAMPNAPSRQGSENRRRHWRAYRWLSTLRLR